MAAPGTPTALTLSLTGTTVKVSWTPATSGDAATEYLVKRGTSASLLRQIGTVAAPLTSYDDRVTEAGTYFYAVVAKKDADESAASETQSIEVRDPPIDLPILTFLFYVGLVVLGIWLAFQVVEFPTIADPTDSLESVSGAVGAYLVRFGVVLLIVAFVPSLVEQLARTFHLHGRFDLGRLLNRDGRITTQAASGAVEVFLGFVGQLPDLLRRPAGYGIAVILLGVLLLVGAAFGFDEKAATASPSPGPTPSGEVTPSPGTGTDGPTPTPP